MESPLPALVHPPAPFSVEEETRCWEHWDAAASRQADPALAGFMHACRADAACAALLSSLFGNAPFLARLALQRPETVRCFVEQGAQACFDALLSRLTWGPAATSPSLLMQALRHAKAEAALIAAAADLTGRWPLEDVTRALSRFADASLSLAVNALLQAGAQRGDIWLAHPEHPAQRSGLIVLGMGKLGAFELNYSSDIDLIILYEPGRLGYQGRHTEQHFFTRLSHDLVTLMQERTPAGYVFRTDLRLRPDPASTPPAIGTEAALHYYESVGQNWERAALIKARPVAGDIEAGEAFLKAMAPFLWRRSLDFAAIQDIHSIKRQMDTRVGRAVRVPGHNLKLGVGGIREIEFFVQVHQLIWGGRNASLRARSTCEALMRLAGAKLIPPETAEAMTHAYRLLRTVEHRLQMVEDQQTHTLPEPPQDIARIATFTGFSSVEAFTGALLATLHSVHEVFASSFQSSDALGDVGNLVFTGVSHDPDTLKTLEKMGYRQPATVSETVMSWHHGAYRCTRTRRARELLTELMPILLNRLAETANPDAAFRKFDEFLRRLPAGVQLFSLFAANPQLLGLIADIMGSAPVLAETLSRHPALLESVLYGDFYAPLPAREVLTAQLDEALTSTHDFEERMEALRRFRNEKQFQAGVQLLQGVTDARHSGAFLSGLCDVLLERLLETVETEFARIYGRIPGARFCILGLGRLGSREMTFGSDVDLVFVYDAPDMEAFSDGGKGFTAGVYYNRLAQRLLHALGAMGREGRLYEADIRLRPSGAQGLPAIGLQALHRYFDTEAWTFEFMALTRARAVAGDRTLCEASEVFARSQIVRPRDAMRLKADVADMRARVAREFPGKGMWDLKYASGGLIELDFLCQYLLLRHAPNHPSLTARGSEEILRQLFAAGLLGQEETLELLDAGNFLMQLFAMARLCLDGTLDEDSALPGLKKLLAASVNAGDFEQLAAQLQAVENTVHRHYMHYVGLPDA